MGWPSTTDLQGDAFKARSAGTAPTCWWTNEEDRSANAVKLSLVLTTWSAMKREFASPRTVVEKTDDDRIRVMAYGEFHPFAVVRFGEDAVVVVVVDGSPDRADLVAPRDLGLERIDPIEQGSST